MVKTEIGRYYVNNTYINMSPAQFIRQSSLDHIKTHGVPLRATFVSMDTFRQLLCDPTVEKGGFGFIAYVDEIMIIGSDAQPLHGIDTRLNEVDL